jgi:hypothetical protein
MSLGEIREIEGLYLVEDLSEEYEGQFGFSPFNLSHWDPSSYTTNLLLRDLRLPAPTIAIPYLYSFPDGPEEILKRLGFVGSQKHCAFTNSGTIAVLLGVWWLKARRIAQTLLLGPSYFPVFHLCDALNLPHRVGYMAREDGHWTLPREEIVSFIEADPKTKALWLTNPIFSTGCYFEDQDISFLKKLLDIGVTVVADECLALNGYELSQRLGECDEFVGLYSPHKALSINSTKFAAIVFEKSYRDFFHCWSDILIGPLASSTHSAMVHFLDENFSHFQNIYCKYLEAVRVEVLQIIGRYPNFIETDQQSVGNFITCYIHQIPGSIGNSEEFLKDLFWHTGACLIPAVRNYMDPDLGFSFRVNLARACPQFYSAISRVVEYLAKTDRN